MKILGYTDRLSVSAGMTIQFMVSSEHRRYRADLVRLIHGDTNSDGPGFKDREVASSVSFRATASTCFFSALAHVFLPRPPNPFIFLKNVFVLE